MTQNSTLKKIHNKDKLLNDLSLAFTNNTVIVIDERDEEGTIISFHISTRGCKIPSLNNFQILSRYKMFDKTIFRVRNKIINGKTVTHAEFLI